MAAQVIGDHREAAPQQPVGHGAPDPAAAAPAVREHHHGPVLGATLQRLQDGDCQPGPVFRAQERLTGGGSRGRPVHRETPGAGPADAVGAGAAGSRRPSRANAARVARV
ncbi:hypothetical protein TPA0910_43630 [Streptomyces hygroscopicus subsp. sporocinereus]|uniref:Uncharacterized protein n=1 Tax=Streptomyces hygroscopicus TaxID=1912 RepID=A0ABQ3U2W6_STRHY|nr:hypothetical protein TPA0910_43630 [Streptomyces hygroscopicus]